MLVILIVGTIEGTDPSMEEGLATKDVSRVTMVIVVTFTYRQAEN